MYRMKIAGLLVLALGACAGLALTSLLQAAQPQAGAGLTPAKQVGSIKSITGNVIVLAPDNGAEVNVVVQDLTRIVRIAPGEKDLKNAVPIALRDLQPGDRILVRGTMDATGQLAASGVIAMKLSDLEVRQQREREEWQKRGVAGLVSGVDDSAGSIAVSLPSGNGKKTVTVRTTKETVIKRYAPDSVRFDDAKPGTLAQIKVGDQLRARGSRNAEGSELTAEEIVSGSFRNIAGSISSVDTSSNTVTVADLASKEPIVVKLTADSDLRNLPPEMAKHVAMRLVGMGSPPGTVGAKGDGRPPGPDEGGETAHLGRPRELQQMFSRLPHLSVSDLHEGDTVMLVATEGNSAGVVTAIKLLDGVEPILAAAPRKGGEPVTLSPWSLGSQGGEESQ